MERTDAAKLNDWWQSKLEATEPILSSAGITAAWWSFDVSLQLSGADYITATVSDASDINQCLGIIAKTPRGADPHRPTFASNVHNYLDWPIPEARPYVVRELVQAVRRWEPRVKLDSLRVDSFKPTESSMSVAAEWSLAGITEQVAIVVDGQ